MSVFTEGQPAQTTTSDNTNDNQTEDWVERVAGDKGEKFRDPNELAKGYVHAQDHIANLTQQIEDMRNDLGKKDYMKEVLDRIDAQQAKPSGGESSANESTSTNDTGHKPEVSVDQIKTLIAETLTEQEAQNTSRENLQEADRLLEDAFGTDAKAKVESRARELNTTPERMKQLAEESPSAFMALMGEAPQKETNQIPSSRVNTQGGFNTTSGQKNFQYYQDLRRKNPRLYYSGKVQQEVLAERTRQGDSFYR